MSQNAKIAFNFLLDLTIWYFNVLSIFTPSLIHLSATHGHYNVEGKLDLYLSQKTGGIAATFKLYS